MTTSNTSNSQNNQKEPPALVLMQPLENALNSIYDCYQNTKSSIKKSDEYLQYQQYKQTAKIQYLRPLQTFYKQLPSNITQYKFRLFSGYTFNQRFMLVNGIAVITALFAFRGFGISGAFSHCLRVIKSTTLTYLGVGLLFTPQIYNPLIKQAPTQQSN